MAKSEERYTSEWGWAASAARFRGVMCIFLALALFFSSIGTFYLYLVWKNNQVVYVAVKDGEPKALERIGQSAIDMKLFCQNFLTLMFNYTPATVSKNMSAALALGSGSFQQAYRVKVGNDFISKAQESDAVNTLVIYDINIEEVRPEGFSAEINGIRYITTNNKTYEYEKIFYLDVIKSSATKKNPWGYSVFSIEEIEKGR